MFPLFASVIMFAVDCVPDEAREIQCAPASAVAQFLAPSKPNRVIIGRAVVTYYNNPQCKPQETADLVVICK